MKAIVSPVSQVVFPARFSGRTLRQRSFNTVKFPRSGVYATLNNYSFKGGEEEKEEEEDGGKSSDNLLNFQKEEQESTSGRRPPATSDGDMLTLRKRIKEIKALEKGEVVKEDWMAFDKEFCCKLYDSEFMETLALLQLHMAKGRPKLAVGMTVMVTIAVPTSVLVAMLHLMDVANWIITGVHPK